MYLTLLFLPAISSIFLGLFGRKLGKDGSFVISISLISLTSLLTIIAYHEVILCDSPVYITLGSWLSSDFLQISWTFIFDGLTCTILIAVVFVSTFVHIYSTDYILSDPHTPRFFCYLSFFTFAIIILVCGDNYLILFLGWELIGVASYLLINFWFTRIAANKAAIQAITVNRIGDIFFTIGLFAIYAIAGNIDFTVFSLSPNSSEFALTISAFFLLFASIGKSAQIGLHTWLPCAMEGSTVLGISVYIAYKIIINIDLNVWIFLCSSLPTILKNLPRATLETITGNMLGDGYIGASYYTPEKKSNTRYAISMCVAAYAYMKWLFDTIYAQYSSTGLKPYPNTSLPQHAGKEIKHFKFDTRHLPLFTVLHSIWYVWNPTTLSFVKIVPACLAEIFGPVSLAHWIMNDGYFCNNNLTIYLCTEGFTKAHCEFLIEILSKIGIVATLNIRNPKKDTYRIRISKNSLDLVRKLVTEHMHPIFIYKLGNKK